MLTNVERKIDVKEFVDKCNSYNSDVARNKYIEMLVLKDKYVDYLVKIKYSKDILQVSCFDKNNDIKVDSCKKYMLYVYTLISLYTDISIKENEMVEAFDLLDRYGLIDSILSCLPEKEKVTFDSVLKMCTDDMMTNYYSVHSYINKKINESYPKLAGILTPLLKNITDKLNDIDEKKIYEFIKNVSK